jgi:hypothetical protein
VTDVTTGTWPFLLQFVGIELVRYGGLVRQRSGGGATNNAAADVPCAQKCGVASPRRAVLLSPHANLDPPPYRIMCHPLAPPFILLALLLLLLSTSSSSSSLPDQRDDDPFNILRAVEAHAVAERNADRAISAADARARAAEKRAEAADAAASASRELALHLQVESNARLTRVKQLEEEKEQLQVSLSAAQHDTQRLMVRITKSLPPSSD